LSVEICKFKPSSGVVPLLALNGMGPRWRALRGALLGDGLPIVVERVEHPIPYNNSLRSDRLRVYRSEILAHADYR